MKSIMEEASSIFKAIEKAWARADKPQSFSVKVLEEATKNFIGMTTKPAKIALLFDEPVSHEAKDLLKHQNTKSSAERPAVAQQRKPQARQQTPTNSTASKDAVVSSSRRPAQEQSAKSIEPRQQRQHAAPAAEKNTARREQPARTQIHPATPWEAQSIEFAKHWLSGMLASLFHNPPTCAYAIESEELVVTFHGLPIHNADQERMFLSSTAHLLMQAVRHNGKNNVRGLRVNLKVA